MPDKPQPETTPAECLSCHTADGHPHTDYCQAVAPAEYPGQPDRCTWLGHRDLCPLQWGETCEPTEGIEVPADGVEREVWLSPAVPARPECGHPDWPDCPHPHRR